MTSTCPKCAKPIATSRPTCFYCGAVLATTTPCVSCGRPLASASARCVFCGAGRTASGKPSAPPAAKPPSKPASVSVAPLGLPEDGVARIQELRRRAEAAAIANIAARDASAPTTTKIQAKMHFERADALDNEGRLDDAIAEYDRAIAIDPSFSPAWSDKGHVLYKMGRFADALACQERARAITPTLVTAWTNTSACLIKLGRPAEAFEAAKRATELAPQSPAPWMNRARCEALLGRPSEAIASYERLMTLGIDPTLIGWVQERIAELRGGALPASARALDEWIDEGVRLGMANDIHGSLRAFDSALALDASAWQAWMNKAVTLAKAGLLLDAFMCAERAVALAPPGNPSPMALYRRIEQALREPPTT